jgi:hypothetical protein
MTARAREHSKTGYCGLKAFCIVECDSSLHCRAMDAMPLPAFIFCSSNAHIFLDDFVGDAIWEIRRPMTGS